MEKDIKTHKRKGKALVDPGDLVSEKSLKRVYKILGQVIYFYYTFNDFHPNYSGQFVENSTKL